MAVHKKCEQNGVSTEKQSRDDTGYWNSIHTKRSGTEFHLEKNAQQSTKHDLIGNKEDGTFQKLP